MHHPLNMRRNAPFAVNRSINRIPLIFGSSILVPVLLLDVNRGLVNVNDVDYRYMPATATDTTNVAGPAIVTGIDNHIAWHKMRD